MTATEESIATRVVNESLGIGPEDVVVITTHPHTIALANAIAMECYRQDADPLTVLDTDEVFYGHMDILSEKSLATTSAHCLGLADYVQYYIWLGGPEDPSGMKEIPESKFSALFEGEKAHSDKSLKLGRRSAGLTIGLVTPQRAKTYGFDFEDWKATMEAAMAASPQELAAVGQRLEPPLAGSGTVRVTAPPETDLTFRLGGRPPQVYDGILDEEDVKRGVLGVELPTGSIDVAVVENSAEGTVAFDVPIPQVGVLIRDMRWEFQGGKLVGISAGENEKALKGLYDGAHGDKDRLGSLSIGTNPKGKTGFLDSWLTQGAVSLSIGDNRGLGGSNESDWGFTGTLARATLEVDGQVLVREGKLVV